VLVRELAREIVPALKPALKPAVGVGIRSKSSGTGSVDLSSSQFKSGLAIAPRRLRRAASEASPGTPLGSVNVNNGLAGEMSFSRLGTAGKTRPPVSAKPASTSSRQRLGDIPWQNTGTNRLGGG